LKITNLKSPITDNKFRKQAGQHYFSLLPFVIRHSSFVISLSPAQRYPKNLISARLKKGSKRIAVPPLHLV
jgi:hypothetical protein